MERSIASRESGANVLLHGVQSMRHARDPRPELALVGSVQAIAVGGGALLSDGNRHCLQSLAEVARCARSLGKPLWCVGCSADGPWSALAERMIHRFVRSCSGIAVRDNVTAGRLESLVGTPPFVFGDFCLPKPPARSGADLPVERGGVAINVCQIAKPWTSAQEEYEEALIGLGKRLARRAAGRGARIRIFTTGLPEDGHAATRVQWHLRVSGSELCLPRNLAGLGAMLRATGIVVATRLHGAILPLAEGVPAVGFAVSPKLPNFFSTMGIGQYCHGPEAWPGLADWLADADCAAVFAEQQQALERSCVWTGKAGVRRHVALLAGAARDGYARESGSA